MNCSSYAITEPSIDDEISGEKEASMASVLATYRETLVERTKHQLGYPSNMQSDYGAVSQLQHCYTDHYGSTFTESGSHGVHLKKFEVQVLDWFARLWEIEKEDYWGYITSSGTEGNLHGILLGRETYPDGVLYASKECHYSIFKAARMYRMELVKVESLVSGEMDCLDLKAQLQERKHRPAIVIVNIGITVKGAVDDLDLVIKTLSEAGFTEDRFYIHCDGALFGFMMPFVEKAPKVTFKKPISSMSVSGHKFIGCPIPCGVQITRKKLINALSRNEDHYCASTSSDATILGSRNIHAPLFMWYTLNRKGYGGFWKDVWRCLQNARYLKDRLREAGFGVMLNELSTTVVFERPPNDSFVRKWQLACLGNVAHVVVMPSVTVKKLDAFVEDLVRNRSACFVGARVVAPCVAKEIGEENCAHCSGRHKTENIEFCFYPEAQKLQTFVGFALRIS